MTGPERGQENHPGEAPWFEVRELSRQFDLSPPLLERLLARLRGHESQQRLKAVERVSFAIPRGRLFSLVGESGCGKSTLARLAVGLLEPTSGEIRFRGKRLQMVFQDPFASLNPRWRVGAIVAEPIRAYRLREGRAAIEARVAELLCQVGLNPADAARYPHAFSGGQRQRISIARALASEPDFLVCDEPTSALDVSVQAQILNLLKELQRRLGLTCLFISHDLAVVSEVSDLVGVMYLGGLVEWGPARRVFAQSRHPYTRLLLDSLPQLERALAPAGPATPPPAAGEPPNPLAPPSGCVFHPRCPLAEARCRREAPRLLSLPEGGQTRCHAVEEGRLPPP